MTPRLIWSHSGLTVWANLTPEGNLHVHGQHLRDGGEYEYFITVKAADVPALVVALGGSSAAECVDLLAANAHIIVTRGERRWLTELGLHPELWVHTDDNRRY
jgi:hypothetical protein